MALRSKTHPGPFQTEQTPELRKQPSELPCEESIGESTHLRRSEGQSGIVFHAGKNTSELEDMPVFSGGYCLIRERNDLHPPSGGTLSINLQQP